MTWSNPMGLLRQSTHPNDLNELSSRLHFYGLR